MDSEGRSDSGSANLSFKKKREVNTGYQFFKYSVYSQPSKVSTRSPYIFAGVVYLPVGKHASATKLGMDNIRLNR